MTDPIVKRVTVPLPPDRAFRLFTQEMSDWWPLDSHSLSAVDGKPARKVTVPPEVGGEVLETKPDGTAEPWGRVTEWSPGRAFAMSWHAGRPEDDASHVRVTFEPVADGTRVTLVHDNWQALGPLADAVSSQYVKTWDQILCARFRAACLALLALTA